MTLKVTVCLLQICFGAGNQAPSTCKVDVDPYHTPHPRAGAMLQKGGCENGQAVIDAFGKMMKQGDWRHCCHVCPVTCTILVQAGIHDYCDPDC